MHFGETVIILFKDAGLKKLCETKKVANKKLGAKSAKKLKGRLADLRAVQSISDLVTGTPHPLRGSRAGEFALRLDGGDRLVFVSADEPVPKAADGSIDWFRVTKVRITFIGDYHD